MYFLVYIHLQPSSGDRAPDTWRVAKAKKQAARGLNLGGSVTS